MVLRGFRVLTGNPENEVTLVRPGYLVLKGYSDRVVLKGTEAIRVRLDPWLYQRMKDYY